MPTPPKKPPQEVQEAVQPFVRFEDGHWAAYDASGALIDVFDTEAEAQQAADKPRRPAGLITDKLRRQAEEPTPPATDPPEEPVLEMVAHLREATRPEGRVWEVVALREGWSDNGARTGDGHYYTREAIEQSAPLFEGAPVQAYGWDPNRTAAMGHIPGRIRQFANGLVLNTIGRLKSPRVEIEGNRAQVVCDFHFIDEPMRMRLLESWEIGGHVPGFSIDGDATGGFTRGVVDGRSGWIVHKIKSITELTMVDKPAAGGAFRRLVAGNMHEEESPMYKKLRARVASRLPKSQATLVESLASKDLVNAFIGDVALLKAAKLKEGISDCALLTIVRDKIASDPDTAAQLLDAYLAQLGEGTVDADPTPDDKVTADPMSPAMVMEAVKKATATVLQEAREIAEGAKKERDAATLERCQQQLAAELKESKLPESAQALIKKQFAGRTFEAAHLLEAIEDHRKVYAATAPAAGVSGQDRGRLTVGTEPRDRWSAKWDRVFGVVPKDEEARKKMDKLAPPRQSARSLYLEMTGDEDFTGQIAPEHLQESATSDIPNIMGTSMSRRMLQDYEEMPESWREIVDLDPNVNNFKQQDVIQWGGLGILPVVSENGTYPTQPLPREEVSHYNVKKRGELVQITLEMMANDDLRTLQRLPSELAQTVHETRARFFYGLACGAVGPSATGTKNTATCYDNIAVYHANHRNIGNTALNIAALQASRLRLRKQLKRGINLTLNNGGPVGVNDTTITLASTVGLSPGDYIQIEAEVLRIFAVTNATAIDVTGGRGTYGTAAAAHADLLRAYHLVRPARLPSIILLYPEDLDTVVDEIEGSDQKPYTMNNEINPFRAAFKNGTLIKHMASESWLAGDPKSWYLLSNPKQRPGVVAGFLNNKQTPDILLQDMPQVGNVFSNDQLTWKVRDIYGGVLADPLAVDGNLVT